tara:strand:+ start:646 stop:1056 length:411 start_codon:yes stop_codon:yes gene_type:complete
MKGYVVDILTPDKVVASGIKALSIKVETMRGEINILPEHTHIITSLYTGLLSVVDLDNKVHRYTVCRGICKVLGNHIKILSSESLSPEEVNAGLVEEENIKMKETLQKTDLMNDTDIQELYDKLDYNNAALKLVKS